MKPVIYAASKTVHAPMWRALRGRGANIISTWIDEAGPGETDDFGELWNRIELEIRQCERLVLFVDANDFQPNPLKGALIEVGMALTRNKPVWILGQGVVLDGRTCRPLGSWIHHPMVVYKDLNATHRHMDIAVGLHGGEPYRPVARG